MESKIRTYEEMKDSGMEIEDKNGCKIVTGSTGTTINGNLWVKK